MKGLLALGLAATAFISSLSGMVAHASEGTEGFKASGVPVTNPADPRYDPELKVCREWLQTGTKAKRKIVCLKNKRWQRVMREGNAFSRALVSNAAGQNLGSL